MFLNIRDAIFVLAGIFQSIFLLIRHRPEVVFIKGGYVGLPLGLASRLLRIDYITHDSDAISGLTNRVIGKGATINAVGMASGSYPYDPAKIVVSGVPISPDFSQKYDIAALKKKLGVDSASKLLLITGGSNGAKRVNLAMASVVPKLIEQEKKLVVAHMMGKGNLGDYGNFSSDRLKKIEFAHNLFEFSAAADLIITRAGANSIAEFAAQSKPCILIPNPYLTGGHQLKNAEAVKKIAGAEVLYEKYMLDSHEVLQQIQDLLADKPKLLSLGNNLHKAFPENADSILADLLLKRKK